MQMHSYAARYDRLASEDVLFNIPERKEYVLQQIGKGKRVLDVGCLGGQFSKLIMKSNNEVWGVEINARAAEEARRRGVRVKVANVEEGLPFDDGSFDVVHAGEILEYLYDTKTFFAETERVLRDGGMLLFSTPNLNSLENRIRVLAGGYLAMSGAYPEDHFGEQVRIFNLPKIKELCDQTGFQVEEVRGTFTLQPRGRFVDTPLSWAARLVPGLTKLLMVKCKKSGSDASH